MTNTSTLHDILDENIDKAITIKNNGNYDKSIELLLKTLHEIQNNDDINIDTKEHLAEIHFELFSNYCHLENYDKAKYHLDLLQTFESEFEKAPGPKYSIAHYYHLIDKNDIAIKILHSALGSIDETSADHDLSIYHHLLFKIYLEEQIIEKARYHFDKTIKYDSEYFNDVFGKIWEAKLLKHEGKFLEATSIFESCIYNSELGKQYKENIDEVYCDLIESCIKINDINKADKYLNEYLKISKPHEYSIRFKYLHAKILKKKNDFDNAEKCFLEITTNDVPDSYISCSMYELAEMYINQEKYEDAIKYLKTGIECKKLNAIWLSSFNCELGRVHNGLGEFEKARKYFIKALKYDRNNYNNRLWLAHVSIMQSKYILALYHLIRLINKYEDDIDRNRLTKYFKITIIRIVPLLQLFQWKNSTKN